MLYQSTRSNHSVSDCQALLEGIAPDGGLYITRDLESLNLDVRQCLNKDFRGMSAEILGKLLPGIENMEQLIRASYAGKFDEKDPVPLVKAGESWFLQLYHGPTSAFKDVALSVLPRLVTSAKVSSGSSAETVILTATSGDTGKAALAGFADVPGTQIFVFFPYKGVSPVQEAQMVTQTGANVHVCAVRGNFDDCQRSVKKAFADFAADPVEGKSFSSANSINIGRLAPQIVYYFSAYADLLKKGEVSFGDPVDFCVPTGNFGDILAGYFAKLMGLPVGRLICASNSNNILSDFFRTGVYDTRREFLKTTSPSMDILVSSNLERLLYLVSGCNAEFVSDCMNALKNTGVYTVPGDFRKALEESFDAGWCAENQVAEEIGRLWRECGYLCDTHTAVGSRVAADFRREGVPMVVLSTASPFKFSHAVLEAIGGDASGSEFDQMERLGVLTGQKAPENLSGLNSKPVLHRDVVNPEEITAYICSKL